MIVCGISGRNSFKGGRMKDLRKSKFLKKGKTVILVRNPEFF